MDKKMNKTDAQQAAGIRSRVSRALPHKPLTAIELFAGAGGLALGIEKAGFHTIGLVEFDKAASDTLRGNRPHWRVVHEDIAHISGLDLEAYWGIPKGELDLLSGGAPCPTFKNAGNAIEQ